MHNFYSLLGISWTPKLGDNDLLGWVTVLGYLITFVLSLFCAIKVNKTREKNSRWFWWLITFIILFLGINKQLDIQTLLLQTGKSATWILGFYEQRRIFQKGFMLGIGMTMLTIFILTGKTLGSDWKKCKLSLLGLLFLVSFVILRGATFNRVFFSGYLFPHYQWILELMGIILIAISAFNNLKKYQNN